LVVEPQSRQLLLLLVDQMLVHRSNHLLLLVVDQMLLLLHQTRQLLLVDQILLLVVVDQMLLRVGDQMLAYRMHHQQVHRVPNILWPEIPPENGVLLRY
jgi:hypothetical protein